MITNETGEECGFGDYSVTEIDHVLIEMPDGKKLSAKLWFPSANLQGTGLENEKRKKLFYKASNDNEEGIPLTEKVPVILEYIPYWKSDFTAERDFRRHSWFSSHGYVALRVDMRGSGDSEGLYFGEYEPQEQRDCMNVMKWVSSQPWSNKKVGMHGKSWSGFNGLQLAYCQPPELQAVISVYSTDDRYNTDINHDGGCVQADALLSWASCMFVWNARAPNPRNCPDWKQMWKERLEKASECWLSKWVKEQFRNHYWTHGSICEDYDRAECPILAIGGWKDGYRDAVLRMVAGLPNVKGIIGPWTHEWPDVCEPGPNMEYLEVCKEFYDYHLKNIENNVMKEPKLRVYLQSHIEPEPCHEYRPGKWIELDGWPTNQVDTQIFYGDHATQLLKMDKVPDNKWSHVPFSVASGMFHGLWLEYDGPYGPTNQAFANDLGLSFTSEELQEKVSLIGNGKFECKAKVLNHNQGTLAVRVVDVFPTGESTMVTYGFLNLTHRDGHTKEEVKPITPGEEIDVSIELHSIAYVIPTGHRLKMVISSAFWSRIWPTNKSTEIQINNPQLKLPIIKDDKIKAYKNPFFIAADPSVGPKMPVRILNSHGPDCGVKFEMDQSNKKYKTTVTMGKPKRLLKPLNTITSQETKEIYEIEENLPLTARGTCTQDYRMEYPGLKDLSMRIYTKSVMYADEVKFFLENSLTTWINDEIFFEKEWKDEHDRMLV